MNASLTEIIHIFSRSYLRTYLHRYRSKCIFNLFYVPSFLYLQATSGGSSEDWGLKFALNHCKSMGWLKHNDRVVVFQKIGDSSVANIVELQD